MSLVGVNISCGLTVRCVVARCDYSAYCDGLIVWATTPKGRSTPLEVWSDSEDLAEQAETKHLAKDTAWVKAAGRRKTLRQSRATSPMRISRSRKPSTSGGCVTLTAPPPPRCFEERVV
jgi:hypothetical protein